MDHLSLDGTWQAARAGEDTWIDAPVPGCVHLDLMAAGLIPDPFFRDNEKAVEWVSERDWIYGRDFQISPSLLGESVSCSVRGARHTRFDHLERPSCWNADNMFRAWEFDVKALLQPGGNRIEVRFDSALRYTHARQGRHYMHGWNSRDGAQWLRKEPCNFGWDWGPRLVTCGIWRPISIMAWEGADCGRARTAGSFAGCSVVNLPAAAQSGHLSGAR